MLTINSAIGKIPGIVDRSRRHGSCQNKPVVGINRSMFFNPIVRGVFLVNPVRVNIPMKLERITVFIKITLRRIMLISRFLYFIIADGFTGGFYQPGVNGNAFIDGVALRFKLTKYFRVDLVHGFFGEPSTEAGEC